jgi:hypothetical protein
VEQALRKTGKPPHRIEVKNQLTARLQQLPSRHCYWYDRRRPYRALPLRVPDVPEPHVAAKCSPDQLAAFIKTHGIQQGRLALPKAALREQIERRQAKLQALLQPVEIRTQESPKPEPPPPQGGQRMRRGSKVG